MRIGVVFAKLNRGRVYALALILSIFVAILIYIYTSSSSENNQKQFPIIPRLDRSGTHKEKTETTRFELSMKPWGVDPFISPVVEENMRRQHEEELRRKKEEEEQRKRDEELRKRREKEEEERRRREEEERKRKEEEERKRKEEESRKRVAGIAARMVAKGVLHLAEGDMVIIGDNGYRVGDRIEADGEKFKLIRIDEEFVVIEDRYGRHYKVRILE